MPALDGLRGVAVALVVCAHIPLTSLPTEARSLTHGLNASGYLGVDIFFVLSGFLITRILLAERGRAVLPFICRRAARIFPLYYLTLGICALYAPEPALAWSAVYASNYWFVWHSPELPLGHLWSLSVEEHFYLAWPWLVKRFTSQTSFGILLLGILPASLVISLALVLLDVPHANQLIYSGTQTRIWSLGLGALCAYREPLTRTIARRIYVRFAWSAIIAIAVLASGIVLARMGLGQVGYLLSYSIVSCWTFLVALGAPDETLCHRMLSRGLLPALGKVSYGIYIVHPFVYQALENTADWIRAGTWSALLFTIALGASLSYGIALFSYHMFESHMIRLGRTWSERLTSSSERTSRSWIF